MISVIPGYSRQTGWAGLSPGWDRKWEVRLDLVLVELAELVLLDEVIEVDVVVSLDLLFLLGENSALPLALALSCFSFCL